MRPMTIVVVRDEPAGGSDAGASALAGAADAVVAGAAEAVAAASGAATAVVAGAADVAGAGAAGLAVVWAKAAEAARRVTARTAGSAEKRFMVCKTIDRAARRQAAWCAA